MLESRGKEVARDIDSVKQFVTDAIDAGWKSKELYRNNPESVELTKNDYKIMVIIKEWNLTVAAWGPDKLALSIPLPLKFNEKQIFDLVNICGECGEKVDKTYRVAFCNRVCEKCMTSAKQKYEKPGWSN